MRLLRLLLSMVLLLLQSQAQDIVIKTFKGYTKTVNSIDISPDGKIMLTGGNDEILTLWDITNNVIVRTFQGHSDDVRSVAFTPDGKRALSVSKHKIGSHNETMILWDLASGMRAKQLRHQEMDFTKVVISPDGKFAITTSSGDNAPITIWDIETGQPFRNFLGHQTHAYSVLFTPDGKFALSGAYFNSRVNNPNLLLWEVANGEVYSVLRGHTDDVLSVAVSANGKIGVSGGKDKRMFVWNLETGTPIVQFSHKDYVLAVAITPDNRYVLSVDDDKQMHLWDITTGERIRTFKSKPILPPVVLSPDGAFAFTNCTDKSIVMWDIRGMLTMVDAMKKRFWETYKSKDEFETEAEYKARVKRGEDQKDMYLNAIKKEHQEKINQSRQQVILHLDTIGTYNPELETFPITIAGMTLNIRIPRAEARSFKEGWQKTDVRAFRQLMWDLQTYETVNYVIVHPVNQHEYPFGEQRYLEGVVSTLAGGAKTLVPPNLAFSLKFVEPSGNNYLDADETGQFIALLTNNGKGGASSVSLQVKNLTNDPNLLYDATKSVGDIKPGESKQIGLNVKANKSVRKVRHTFEISVLEANGFFPEPVKVSFETKAFALPQIVKVDEAVTTATGGNIPKPGETATIKVRFQNKGDGLAKNLKFTVATPKGVYVPPESKTSFIFEKLDIGDWCDIEFTVLPSKTVGTETTIPIEMVEDNSRETFQFKLIINKPYMTAQELEVKGKEAKKTETKDVATLSVDIEKNIPQTEMNNPDAVAVVIGISQYKNQDVPRVDYAKRGALIMKQYLIKTLGYDEKRIIDVYDENAGLSDFKRIFEEQLARWVKEEKSDLFIYYNGHGAPDVETNEPYFVPYDCNPSFARSTGYPVKEFYTRLSKIKAKSITVILDACFSGSTPKGILLKQVSPALLKVKEEIVQLPNGLIITSGTGDQLANWYAEKQHSLFTYYFLKGLQGEADSRGNLDKQLTVNELETYLQGMVPEQARYLNNKEQTPQINTLDKQKVLVIYP